MAAPPVLGWPGVLQLTSSCQVKHFPLQLTSPSSGSHQWGSRLLKAVLASCLALTSTVTRRRRIAPPSWLGSMHSAFQSVGAAVPCFTTEHLSLVTISVTDLPRLPRRVADPSKLV